MDAGSAVEDDAGAGDAPVRIAASVGVEVGSAEACGAELRVLRLELNSRGHSFSKGAGNEGPSQGELRAGCGTDGESEILVDYSADEHYGWTFRGAGKVDNSRQGDLS